MSDFDFKSVPLRNAPSLKNLKIIGHYSIDGDHEFHSDLSQMKYLRLPSDRRRIDFDLNKDYELTRRKAPDEFKLNFLLKWLRENYINSTSEDSDSIKLPDFVCFRGVLLRIAATPYERYNGWIVCASRIGNTIYLCYYDTEKQKEDMEKRTEKDKQMLTWGFKFEQYLLADTPSAKPDLSVPLNENEEFCCMFKSSFGTHTLLYGAEMDGINSKNIINDTLIGKNIKFVELKTIEDKCFDRRGNIHKFKAWKLLKWWLQCYLVGISKIIIGCRNKKGIVNQLKEYSDNDLLIYGKGAWDANNCKGFLNAFLHYLKRTVVKDHKECLYKFSWNPGNKSVNAEELDPMCDLKFLSEEYINHVNKMKKRRHRI